MITTFVKNKEDSSDFRKRLEIKSSSLAYAFRGHRNSVIDPIRTRPVFATLASQLS